MLYLPLLTGFHPCLPAEFFYPKASLAQDSKTPHRKHARRFNITVWTAMLGVLDDSSNKILSDSRDELMIGVELS
jgi:hypothetical protein